MVYVELAPELGISAEAVESALRAEGVLAGITGPRHFRLVCHYWIKDDDLPVIMAAFKKALNRA
jgi:acetylornithine/succinyldiaminopimelate/putrescine aminotransferase